MSPTDTPDDGSDGEDSTPEDAFMLLSHEIRIGILHALWRALEHSLSPAVLRDRVSVRDSGQFSYHLSALTGRLVAHGEDAARYRLQYSGHRSPTTRPVSKASRDRCDQPTGGG